MMRAAWIVLWGLLGAAVCADAGEPVVLVQAVRPEGQWEAICRLFEGSRAEHPAAALSAWKRAGGRGLGKPLEAAIAAFNPEMGRELKGLDGAMFAWDGAGSWRLGVPHDDGSLGAMVVAMGLTDGGVEAPLGGASVDRLDAAGRLLAARRGERLVIGTDREGLAAGLDELSRRPNATERWPIASGWVGRLDVEALRRGSRPEARGYGEAAGVLGIRDVTAIVGVEGDRAEARVIAERDAVHPARPIDLKKLNELPAERLVGAICVGVDGRSEGFDRLFRAADAFERASTGRADRAPWRARLGVTALARGIRLESEVWPKLRGVRAAAYADAAGKVDGLLLGFDLDSEASAKRWETAVLPRLLAPLRAVGAEGPAYRGKAIRVGRRGDAVIVSWGEGLLEAMDAASEGRRASVGSMIAGTWATTGVPSRFGLLLPGQLPGSITGPAADALGDAPAVMWLGGESDGRSIDTVRWEGLKGVVVRVVERLPRPDAANGR